MLYGIPLQTILAIVGPVLGVAFVLYKAYSMGKDAKELEQKRIQEYQEQQLRGAEAKNATEDWKRDQRINEVSNVKSVLDLIQLWNARFKPKDKDQPPSKEP